MKRQNYVFGSNTSNIKTQSVSELNTGWAELSILYSKILNGVCNALSSSTNDVSQEVSNAIEGMGVTLDAQNSSQLLAVLQTFAIKSTDFESPITSTNKGITKSELTALNATLTANINTKATKETDFESPITSTNKGATMKEIEEVQTSSLTFKGFVGTSEPTQTLVTGNIWINANEMPTTFPVSASSIQQWNGTAWVAYGSDYTPMDFDFFRNNNNNEGYYWFGGEWKVMSTDMSTEYFTLNQTSGKWEIKDSINIPGTPTVATPDGDTPDAVANVEFVKANAVGTKMPLLYHTWSDHLLNDVSWLRADTFSWQSGDVYKAAYNHLASEMYIENLYAWQEEESRNVYTKSATPSVGDSVYRTGGGLYGTVQSVGADNITVNGMNFPRNSGGDILGTNAETDTVDDITITFYRAEDGHKICLPDQEDNILALYNATGVAWYYILDEDNTQFKLPRTKFGFTGLRDEVGNIAKSDYAGSMGGPDWDNKQAISSGFITPENGYVFGGRGAGDDMSGHITVNDNTVFLVSTSHGGNVYGIAPVAEGDVIGLGYGTYYFVPCKPLSATTKTSVAATQMYLYFYVGNFDQSAIEQTAGLNAELFNNKMDINTPLTRDIFSPEEWENESMEQILSEGAGTGDLVFTKNWQEYDYLWFSSVSDGSSTLDDSPHWLNVKWMLAQAKSGVTNLAVVRYSSGSYWYVNPQEWTTTTMPRGSQQENLFINKVYGIKLKNITAQNVGLLNYKGLFETATALVATVPTAMGQWAIVQSDETQNNLQTKYFSTKDVNGNYVWLFGGVIDSSLVGADYVVESQLPTEANGYTWYRKYKSGWIEQGGSFGEAYTAYTTKTITLPVEMADTKYSVCLTNASTGDSYAPVTNSKTVTTFVAYRTTNYQGLGTWQVSGMSAQ